MTAEGFIAGGAEIGLILLLFSLGLEYTAAELVGSLRSTARIGVVDLLVELRCPASSAGCCSGGTSSPRCSSAASPTSRRRA